MDTSVFGISLQKLLLAGAQTLYMLGWGMLIGGILGIAIALVLVLTRPNGLTPNRAIYWLVNMIVNILRSVPFIILLVTIIPFTRLIMGTPVGTQAQLVPLTLYIAPYIARLVESSLLEVKPGVIEAAQAMGASKPQIVRHFLLPEAYASIVLAMTTGVIGLLGATAMAGYGGGGGIGDLALTYGRQAMNTPLMIFTVVVLVIFVQAIQALGNAWARRLREPK